MRYLLTLVVAFAMWISGCADLDSDLPNGSFAGETCENQNGCAGHLICVDNLCEWPENAGSSDTGYADGGSDVSTDVYVEPDVETDAGSEDVANGDTSADAGGDVMGPDTTDATDAESDVVQPDTEGDGVSDEEDNCPYASNMDQRDTDGDGIGDVCDANSVTDCNRRRGIWSNCPAGSCEDIDGIVVAAGSNYCKAA